MEGLRPSIPDISTEYHPMRSCDSDDSQSSASRSEDNDIVPNIIYTSDDSADVGQSDSTYIESDLANYIAQDVNQRMEDELSQQFLLEPDMTISPHPANQVDIAFMPHPLAPINRSISSKEINASLGQNLSPIYGDRNEAHLQVNTGDGLGLTRSNSASSSSTETEYTAEVPFLARYEPLPCYSEEENYAGGLKFNVLNDDPIKSKVIHDQLNSLSSTNEAKPTKLKNNFDRFYVGQVPIDARYKDAFFVKWNWPRIRQTCVFINLSILLGFLCVGVGLIIQMPKGSDCNTIQEWWQGSTSYYIFVPSFMDTDADGYGDISGVIARLDYLQGLGIKTVRLAPVFQCESFIDRGTSPTNYTEVAPSLGDAKDLHLLSALLHERDMFLILDIPLAKTSSWDASKVPSAAVDLEEVPRILNHWVGYGVDGFAFTDLDKLIHMDGLVPALHQWRNCLDQRSRGLDRRVMMVPIDLLKKLEATSSMNAEHIVRIVDLIDVRLDLSQSSDQVASAIEDATRWDKHASLPWINWRIGGPFEPRVTDLAPENPFTNRIPALGFTLLQLFLPGTVTLYYGDEIGVTLGDENKLDLSWAAPMAWTPKNGGFSKGLPWLSLGENWKERNVASLNQSLGPLITMIESCQKQVPLYINGIFEEDVGSFHPLKSDNYKIRYASENLLIIDRFYPRRNKFAIVVNLGPDILERDFSKLYYGGRVLASSHDKKGYVRFKQITLQPREGLALVLDK